MPNLPVKIKEKKEISSKQICNLIGIDRGDNMDKQYGSTKSINLKARNTQRLTIRSKSQLEMQNSKQIDTDNSNSLEEKKAIFATIDNSR